MPYQESFWEMSKRFLSIEYAKACREVTEINEHLPRLVEYAHKCKHITEFGVHLGYSTRAFLYAEPVKLVSVDKLPLEPSVELLKNLIAHTDWQFIQGDTREIDIEETDLLFIDTCHAYWHLQKELYFHGNKASKYIILHDTEIYGHKDETDIVGYAEEGLIPAIEEFMEVNKHWSIKEQFTNNCGLTVLERKENK